MKTLVLVLVLVGGACIAGNESADSAEPQPRTVVGTIELVSIDDDSGGEQTVVNINTDDGEVLGLAVVDSDMSFLGADDRVSVTGTIEAGVIRCGVDDVAILEKAALDVIAVTRTTRKVAVILVNFANDTGQPITKADAMARIFTDPTSANAFLEAASYGQLAIVGAVDTSGDVFGWYTIADQNDDCDTSTWRRLASEAASQAGANLAAYDHVMYVVPSAPQCGWGGLGAVGGKWTIVKAGYMGGLAPAHELGHNLGLSHSSSYRCERAGTPVTLSSTCTVKPYGDPFDTMGGAYRHFNGYQKARLGWLSSSIETINTDGDHTVDIAPFESTSAVTKVVRVYRPSQSDYYYLEYRQPTAEFDTFDSTSPVVNGLSIRVAPDPSTRKAPLLLDMAPATATFADAPLQVGRTWADLDNRIAITLVSHSATGARVRVVVGGGEVFRQTEQ
jgi:hypothetical protein